ncbi:MAG: alpha/beta hydrolase [Chloroflexi bacterium]|nr:alpha/beta hydrolase [Chloroflexota bacterium]
MTSPIPYTTYSGSGPTLHFAHANGYPPGCYRPLLTRLAAHYRVLAMHQRPLWPDSRPEDIVDWLPLTDDLLRFLDQVGSGPIIGVGHSMGGIATLRAALREPERFHALVLLDPVLFPPRFILSWRLIRALGLDYRLHPLVSAAINRRQVFESREKLFRGYRRKSVFKYMDDEALHAYVEGITCPHEPDGYQLCYSADWEARIYVTGVWRDMGIWRKLPSLRVPTLIVRGAETDTFWASSAKKVRRLNPAIQVITLEKATHLVPLERPASVFQAIHTFLSSLPT